MAPSPELGQPKAPDKGDTTKIVGTAVVVTDSTASTDGVARPNQGEQNATATATSQPAASSSSSIAATRSTSSAAGSSAAVAATVAAAIATTVAATATATVTTTSTSTTANTSTCTSTTTTTTTAIATVTATTTAATATSITAQQDTENLENWTDDRLKALLDEAMSYTGTKEHKSEIFKELLQNTEREDKARGVVPYHLMSHTSSSSSRTSRTGSGRHQKKSGSLQDLAEIVHSDMLLYGDFAGIGHSKKHHHNSRAKKHTPSVSLRHREGCSLPSNVNVATCYMCPDELPLLTQNDKVNCPRAVGGVKQNVGQTDSSGCSPADGCYNNRIDEITPLLGGDLKSGHTIIDMGDMDSDETQHLLAHDALAQGYCEPLSGDESTEYSNFKKLPRVSLNYTSCAQLEISFGESSRSVSSGNSTAGASGAGVNNASCSTNSGASCGSSIAGPSGSGSGNATSMPATVSSNTSAHSVDKTVPFSLIENGNRTVDNIPVPLSTSYSSVQSVVDNKSDIRAAPVLNIGSPKFLTTPILPHQLLDENGNSVPSSFNSSLPSTSSQSQKQKIKKVSKGDRNTRILKVEEMEGFRGDDNIDLLVSFIENNEKGGTGSRKNGSILNKLGGNNNSRSNQACATSSSTGNSTSSSNQGGGNAGGGPNASGGSSNTNQSSRKKHNSAATAISSSNKKDTNKLKKSNSLDELSSCTKLESMRVDRPEVNASTTSSSSSSSSSATSAASTVTLRGKSGNKKSPSDSFTQSVKVASSSVGPSVITSTPASVASNKRTERRSWGTEELTYLGDNNLNVSPQTSTVIASGVSVLSVPQVQTNAATNLPPAQLASTKAPSSSGVVSNMRKRDEQSLSIVSIESISTSSETAEFHVVTKKKKPKKRQNTITGHDDSRHANAPPAKCFSTSGAPFQRTTDHIMHQNSNAYGGNRSKYHTVSSHFANDRDVYMNSLSTADSRRKSTSSVPPSEKSDSSDLDSVHSLPIESTSSSMRLASAALPATSTSSGGTPQASYADIARIANATENGKAAVLAAGIGSLEKWPSVSSRSFNDGSFDNSNASTCSSGSVKSQGSVVRGPRSTTDTGDYMTPDETRPPTAILYSQSLVDVAPVVAAPAVPVPHLNGLPPIVDNSVGKKGTTAVAALSTIATGGDVSMKNILLKSKSIEGDAYCNIDQYPALERTVKSSAAVKIDATATASLGQVKISPPTKVSSKPPKMDYPPLHTKVPVVVTDIVTPQHHAVAIEGNNNRIVNKPPTSAVARANAVNNNNSYVENSSDSTAFVNATYSTNPTNSTNLATTKYQQTSTATRKTPLVTSKRDRTTTPAMANHLSNDAPTASLPHHNHQNRPAVIILNDSSDRLSRVQDEITFGFDIDKHLLFGDFDGDDDDDENEDDEDGGGGEDGDGDEDDEDMATDEDTGLGPMDDNMSPIPDHINKKNETKAAMPEIAVANISTSSDPGYLSSCSIASATNVPTSMPAVPSKTVPPSSRKPIAYTDSIAHDNAVIATSLAGATLIRGRPASATGELSSSQIRAIVPKPQRQANNAGIGDCKSTIDQMKVSNPVGAALTLPPPAPIIGKQLSVRYIAPVHEFVMSSSQHDEIVHFVGLAWEDVICGANGAVQYYNGQ